MRQNPCGSLVAGFKIPKVINCNNRLSYAGAGNRMHEALYMVYTLICNFVGKRKERSWIVEDDGQSQRSRGVIVQKVVDTGGGR